jgi:serine/threonine protein kinase
MSENDGPRLPPVAGRYQFLDVISDGDTGVVYRAMDTILGWAVAVKALHECLALDSTAARRFTTAARILGQLPHPAIPAVHNIGALSDGRPFFVMRLIRGRTVQDVLDDQPETAADRGPLLTVFERVCEAVAYAHAKGVAHRNLKSAHVMIGAFGEVQLLG